MADEKIHLEAEDGELVGTRLLTDGSGFTGRGYVGGFEAPGTAIHFSGVRAAGGIYSVRVRYRAPGLKGIEVVANGRTISGIIPASPDRFATHTIGKVELAAGENEIGIERGWGYFQIDALELARAPAPKPLRPVPAAPIDRRATREARALLRRLTGTYGARTLSGQQGLADAAYVRQEVGVSPAIVCNDLIDYSPSRVARGARPDITPEQIIAAHRGGQIVSVQWHWNAPKNLLDKKYKNERGEEIDASWYKGFYTNATTFDVARALSDPRSEDFALLLRDIDAIAVPLKQLAAAHVPVLWRPLHEAEGGWFWWGAKGPEPLKKLWRLLYSRLTGHHGLHNLLWVFTSGGKRDWYPGDDVVDIVGVDAYPSDVSDPLTGIWDDLSDQFDGRKLLALTEFGGVPDIQRMRRFGVRWAYFASWSGTLGPRKVTPDELRRLYRQPGLINRR